ncbi:MAG: tetratricopeptide repeat protein [Verrucomicrobiota bacterium JB022]|nr:tetratricopeptide repeat protein [Verrucomicrobiota bacterium JB022]
MFKHFRTFSTLALALVSVGSVHGQLFPLSENSWSNPEFRERFLGSYGVDTSVNPEISLDEKTLFEEITPLIQSNNARGAIAALQRGIKPESSAAFDFILGNLYYQEQDMAKAIPAYQQAIKKFPNFYRAYVNIGRSYVSQNNWSEALKHLQKAMELKPGDGSLYGLLGYCYMNQGEYTTALDSYRMAIMLQPSSKDWKLGKMKCLEALNEHEETIAMLYEFIEKEPENAEWWMLQANEFLDLQKPELAAANLEIVRQLGKAKPATLMLLGDIYINQGLIQQGTEAYGDALTSGEVKTDRVLRVGYNLASHERFDEVAEIISKFRASPAGSKMTEAEELEVLNLEAKVALGNNQNEKAAELLENVVSRDPMNGRALLSLIDYYQQAGDAVKATYYAEQAAKLEEFRHPALLSLARIKVGQKEFGAASRYLRQAQDIKPLGYVADYLAQVERAADSQ